MRQDKQQRKHNKLCCTFISGFRFDRSFEWSSKTIKYCKIVEAVFNFRLSRDFLEQATKDSNVFSSCASSSLAMKHIKKLQTLQDTEYQQQLNINRKEEDKEKLAAFSI